LDGLVDRVGDEPRDYESPGGYFWGVASITQSLAGSVFGTRGPLDLLRGNHVEIFVPTNIEIVEVFYTPCQHPTSIRLQIRTRR
jgi:hypothetical protein